MRRWADGHVSPWDDWRWQGRSSPAPGTPKGPTVPPGVDARQYREAMRQVEALCGCEDCRSHPWPGPTMIAIIYR